MAQRLATYVVVLDPSGREFMDSSGLRAIAWRRGARKSAVSGLRSSPARHK